MKIAIFSGFDIALNPYIIMFKNAVEQQGIKVKLERDLTFNWWIKEGLRVDGIHLHWVNYILNQRKFRSQHADLAKMLDNRLVNTLIYILSLFHYIFLLIIIRLSGKKIVFTVHDLDKDIKQSRVWVALNNIAHYTVCLLADKIHVHNEYSRKRLKEKYRRQRGVITIPHGNYIGVYPNTISRTDAKRKLGILDEAFVYLFLGLLRPYKGLEDLIRAFDNPGLKHGRLVIAGQVFGSNSYGAGLAKLAQKNKRITLVQKFIPDADIQLYMNACDIFVLPYKHITTSGAAALALSFGRPIIAPAITSFTEVVTKETGILYEPSEKDALSNALVAAGRRAWSESDIYKYANQFSWKRLGSDIIRLYGK